MSVLVCDSLSSATIVSSVAHRWAAHEAEHQSTLEALASAQRSLERQQRQFRAALSQRDQHCFDLNQVCCRQSL